jgi:hypothetical protein
MTAQEEIRGIMALLRGIEGTAENASLTGGLGGGAKVSVRHYNAALKRLGELEAVGPGLFSPLSEETGMDEVGAASAHLAAYLRGSTAQEPSSGEAGTFQEAFRTMMDEKMRKAFGGFMRPKEGGEGKPK